MVKDLQERNWNRIAAEETGIPADAVPNKGMYRVNSKNA